MHATRFVVLARAQHEFTCARVHRCVHINAPLHPVDREPSDLAETRASGHRRTHSRHLNSSEDYVRDFFYTFAITLALSTFASAQAQSTVEVVGCLSRAPNGTLQFRASESGRVFAINGDVNLLQHYVNHLVAIPEPVPAGSRPLSAGSIRDIADTCTATPSTAQAASVAGKAGLVETAPPVTSTAVVDETTAGFQTEAGAI